jgi:hypothetical protein
MKKKFSLPFFSAGLLYIGLSTSCLASAIPDIVDINLQKTNPALTAISKDSKTVPGFQHAKHATTILEENSGHAGRTYNEKFSCTTCHAGVERPEDIGSEAAKLSQVAEVTAAGSVKNYMHGLCLECHKTLKSNGLTTGPTSCSGCHNPK